MRVLWFSNTPAAGDDFISNSGTGGWLKSLDKAIQDKVELHVAFYDRHYPSEFRVGKTIYHQIAPLDRKSLVIRRIKMLMGENPDIQRYYNVINQVKPDLIHIHGTERPWIQLTKDTDIPVLLSIQGIVTVITHKYFSGIEKKYFSSHNSNIMSYKRLVKEGGIEREYLQYIHYVMGRTAWDKRVYSVLAPHAKYFYGGEILRDGFYEFKWMPHWTESHVIIHTTTGGMAFKGLETICKAVSILTKAGLNVEWRIAGIAEDDKLVMIVKRMLGSDYPSKGITFLGSLNEDDLVKKMLQADIYVNASHQDNSPNSLCEAMLLGMPCVATCAGGTSTILKDDETGLLVQDGDPWGIAGAVLELSNNQNKAEQYATKARDVATQRHNKALITDGLIDVYNFILENSKK